MTRSKQALKEIKDLYKAGKKLEAHKAIMSLVASGAKGIKLNDVRKLRQELGL